tara:strand:- start:326 stop:1279 length:954 start_codon:yes stop_codon:yes gene_type:complete
MSNNENTQLTPAIGFTSKHMIFGKPQENNITLGDGKTTIKFFRIPVGVKNPDGTVGELVFATEKVFSFGLQENKNDTGKVDGYSIPLCMFDKDGATDAQEKWLVGFNNAIDCCKKHIISVKDQLERYDLEESELKRFNPMYYKREKGKIVEGRGPTLYPKLLVSKKESPPKILTGFQDANDDEIDPLTLLGKYCWITAAVKVESIFIGAKISPQIKLYEAVAKPLQSKSKRLLRPTADKKISLLCGDMSSALGGADEDDSESEEEDNGSLKGDSDIEEEDIEEEDIEEEEKPTSPEKPAEKKKVRRKVVRKKKKVSA